MIPSYDWEHWKRLYVTGGDEVTLLLLSGMSGAPPLGSLKKRSRRDSWMEQRKAFRSQVLNHAAQAESVERLVDKTEALVNAAEAIARHVQLGKALQAIGARALKLLRPEDLSPKDILNFIKEGANIERLAIGLSTENTQTTHLASIDFDSLTDEQLFRLARGENPESVLK